MCDTRVRFRCIWIVGLGNEYVVPCEVVGCVLFTAGWQRFVSSVESHTRRADVVWVMRYACACYVLC